MTASLPKEEQNSSWEEAREHSRSVIVNPC